MQQELIILISKIADEIAENVPIGTKLSIDGNIYEVVEIQTDPFGSRYLSVHGDQVIYGSPNRSWYEISEKNRAHVESANRKDYLFFAKNWLQIMKGFRVEEDKIIWRLRQEFPNAWNPWDEVIDDEIDENQLVKERCKQIITDPNTSDEDKEEAKITLTICNYLFG